MPPGAAASFVMPANVGAVLSNVVALTTVVFESVRPDSSIARTMK